MGVSDDILGGVMGIWMAAVVDDETAAAAAALAEASAGLECWLLGECISLLACSWECLGSGDD